MKKLFTPLILALLVLFMLTAAVPTLKVVRFEAINETKENVSFRLEYLDQITDIKRKDVPQTLWYITVPPDGLVHTYTVPRVNYRFTWYAPAGTSLKETYGLTYNASDDALDFLPHRNSVLRFKTEYGLPDWYINWLDKNDLESNYLIKWEFIY